MENTDAERAIDDRTSIRLPIGLLVSALAGVALFLYGQDHAIEAKLLAKFSVYEEKLDRKAEKTSSADRYTGAQAAERNRAVDQRFTAMETANAFAHEAIRREIDHIHEDLNKHLEECKRNHEH